MEVSASRPTIVASVALNAWMLELLSDAFAYPLGQAQLVRHVVLMKMLI
jgi:hypothetical protein